jgi:hypothetical protein
MVVGHSFGASVVFNSIGQILLARFLLDAEKLASVEPRPSHAQTKPGLVSGYGDLVVLVNPAIEATRIVPFFTALNDYTAKSPDLLSPAQPPRLVILSSQGDSATRRTFPIARAVATTLESYQNAQVRTPYGQEIELRERYLDWQTMGNVEGLLTHEPLRKKSTAPWDGTCPPAQPEWLKAAIEARKRDVHRIETPRSDDPVESVMAHARRHRADSKSQRHHRFGHHLFLQHDPGGSEGDQP